MKIYLSCDLGSYNWADPSKKQWRVVLQTPFGNVSETFPEDERPVFEYTLPSEAAEKIEKRVDGYWISTSRDTTKENISKIREHIKEVDNAWIDGKIEGLKEKILKFEKLKHDSPTNGEK